jgi:signal transduction histidine kinase
MRRRRLPLGLVLPIALVLLVGSLAALQYKWLGQVSEAEREEMRASLEQRAKEFADDFDRELSRVYVAFENGSLTFDPMVPGPFAARFDEWRASARFPGIIRDVYAWQSAKATSGLSVYDPERRRFDPIEWPADLGLIRTRVSTLVNTIEPPLARGVAANGARGVMIYSGATLISDVPALILPLPGSSRALIVQLDREYLTTTVLPALVDLHFPESGSDRYRVAVVDGDADPIVTRNLPKGQSIDPDRADVATPFFGLRIDLARQPGDSGHAMAWSVLSDAPALPARPELPSEKSQVAITVQRLDSESGSLRVTRTGWQILLQHAAGSLDAAVSEARLRNLWMSFGILSVLAVGMGLVVLNARRSERLASQQMDFVATVSHELRTPLAVIRSAAQNLSAGVVHDAGQARRYGDLIEDEGRRLTDMVEQVLEYAGLSGDRRSPRARPVDAGSLVRDVVSSCAPLFEAEGFHVEVNVATDLSPVLAEEDGLRRALHNLVTNALKYGADGRWVRVAASAGASHGHPEILLSVADRGRGIEAVDLPHVFEPFFRGRHAVERQIHGNGLGLSLVKRIVEAHGGRVTVKSAPGEGSTFILHLPAASPDPAVRSAAAQEPSAGRSAAG